MPDALCIGEALIAFTPANRERLDQAASFESSVGGAEFNVAIGLRSEGVDAAWAGLVGDDPFGRRIRTALERAGVDASMVETVAGRSTGVYVKPRFDEGALYHRRGSAGSQLSRRYVDRLARTIRPRMIHISGVSAQASESGADALKHIVTTRPFGDAIVSFDVNHRSALHSEKTPSDLFDLARRADVVFVGLDEADALWQTSSIPEVRALLPSVPWLVVKDAGHIAREHHGDCVTSSSPASVEIVEPTGAGDAFAAGWIASYLRGGDATERLAGGHRRAAAVLESIHDTVLPSGAHS